jgi:hypothetical protein
VEVVVAAAVLARLGRLPAATSVSFTSSADGPSLKDADRFEAAEATAPSSVILRCLRFVTVVWCTASLSAC